MPNWCENRLCVYCIMDHPEELSNFIEIVKNPEDKSDLSMGKLLPCPDELLKQDSANKNPDDYRAELIKKYGHADCDDWCVANWGTKWDLCSVRTIEYNDNYIVYDFESAWSPPTNWVIAIMQKFPNLNFRLKYDESGMKFFGVLEIEDGKIRSNVSVNY